ncbi:MAG TPA: PIN domain-containing protein [Gemmata sp.]
MILLDTDHVSVLRMPESTRRSRLVARLALAAADEVIAVPVVVTEETMRGWLSALAKERKIPRQVLAYRELAETFRFFARFPIVAFDEAAADLFDQFGRIRIGTPDKKIAAIALANNALRLTANRRDFEQIPHLRFDNWMDPATP